MDSQARIVLPHRAWLRRHKCRQLIKKHSLSFLFPSSRSKLPLVVAIEISPASVECLRRNLAPEIAVGRAIVYPKGVWDKNDTLSLNVDDENFAANSVVLHAPGARGTVQVQLTTIDQIVNELALLRVDFIKMDVEGAEVNALHGARETLRRFRPRLAIATEH